MVRLRLAQHGGGLRRAFGPQVDLSERDERLEISRLQAPQLFEGSDRPCRGLGIVVPEASVHPPDYPEDVRRIGCQSHGDLGLRDRLADPAEPEQEAGRLRVQVRLLGGEPDGALHHRPRLDQAPFFGEHPGDGEPTRRVRSGRLLRGRRGHEGEEEEERNGGTREDRHSADDTERALPLQPRRARLSSIVRE